MLDVYLFIKTNFCKSVFYPLLFFFFRQQLRVSTVTKTRDCNFNADDTQNLTCSAPLTDPSFKSIPNQPRYLRETVSGDNLNNQKVGAPSQEKNEEEKSVYAEGFKTHIDARVVDDMLYSDITYARNYAAHEIKSRKVKARRRKLKKRSVPEGQWQNFEDFNSLSDSELCLNLQENFMQTATPFGDQNVFDVLKTDSVENERSHEESGVRQPVLCD